MRAFPSQKRVSTLQSQIDEFLFCRQQGIIACHSLLGWLSSLCFLAPGGGGGVFGCSLFSWSSAFDGIFWTNPWFSLGPPRSRGTSSGGMTWTICFRVSPSRSSTQTCSSALLGSSHPRPICLRSVVGCGAFNVHQHPQASCDSSGTPPFRGLTVRVFTDNTTALSYALSLLDRVCGPVSGSPVYRGGPERYSRLPEPSSSGPRFGVDLGSGSF